MLSRKLSFSSLNFILESMSWFVITMLAPARIMTRIRAHARSLSLLILPISIEAESQNIPNTGIRYRILMVFENDDIREIIPIAIVAYIKNTPAPANLSLFLYIKAKIKIRNAKAINLKIMLSNLKS